MNVYISQIECLAISFIYIRMTDSKSSFATFMILLQSFWFTSCFYTIFSYFFLFPFVSFSVKFREFPKNVGPILVVLKHFYPFCLFQSSCSYWPILLNLTHFDLFWPLLFILNLGHSLYFWSFLFLEAIYQFVSSPSDYFWLDFDLIFILVASRLSLVSIVA